MDRISEVNNFLRSIHKTTEEKFVKPLAMLDSLVTQNLHHGQINTRPAGSNGLWCFALLPIVLVVNILLYDVSQAYKLAACLSVGLFVYGIFLNYLMSLNHLVSHEEATKKNHLVLTESSGGCLMSGAIASTLVYTVVKPDIMLVLISALPSAFIFSALLRRLLECPRTFTVGEATIVAQSVVIAVTVMVAKVTCDLGDMSREVDLVNAVVITVLSTVGLIVTALYWLRKETRTVEKLSYIMIVAAGLALVQIHWALGLNCIPKLFTFLFMDRIRVSLLAFWLFLVLLAVVVLVSRTRQAGKASSGTRKSFHLLAAAVFASGVLVDEELMEMAAGVGLGLLIFVEALRKSGIEPISSALQSAFLVYSDDKDCGTFALTPIYMYCGLLAGLLSPRSALLERLSGVLAVGVGDAAASWLGERYGKRKWPGQNRTVEGTLFNVLSQVLTVYCLLLFDALDGKNALPRTLVAATVSSLVEANTAQVDNLVLPLVTLIAFQATCCVS